MAYPSTDTHFKKLLSMRKKHQNMSKDQIQKHVEQLNLQIKTTTNPLNTLIFIIANTNQKNPKNQQEQLLPTEGDSTTYKL